MIVGQYDQEKLKLIASNWRLTPATIGYKLSKGQWIPAPWLQYVSTRVAAGIMRGGARIIISAPPRHGKSELISVHTSTWVLENFSNKNVILAAYGADLAEQYGRRVRDQIRDNEGLLKCRVRADVAKVSAFLTESNGYMYSVGLGGAITGRGAHVLLIDDYIKEIKEALSPSHRQYIWDWFVTTAMTRLEPGASVIIIATRWHSDDLIGRILKNFPGRWENICLPAEAMENDILGRKPGEALFPERFNEEYLQEQRVLLGSIYYHALYQQGPVDEVLKFTNPEWLKVTTQLTGTGWKWCRIWDLAATAEGGDYTTGSLCGYSASEGKFVVANIIRKQLGPKDVEAFVRRTAIADGLDVAIGVEKEPGASGLALVNHFETNVLPEFRVFEVPTVKSKIIRAQPFLAAAEAGTVYLLSEETVDNADTKGWHGVFKTEFETFPSGDYDDQVDTVSAGYVHLTGRKIYSAAWGRKRRDREKDRTDAKMRRQASFMIHHNSRRSRVTFGK